MRRGMSVFNVMSVALGLAFLYLPIAILVVNSFNDSRLVTVWSGASLRWYRALANDAAMLDAASVSFRIAFLSATAATVLGTLAALALTRGGRFRGRLMFSGMIYAPLVMPEVITGLSLLLLFVAVDIDRGFWTIAIAHTTLTMCFVTVVVQSRLGSLDRSLEEAAMDLGCDPVRAFLSVTLPLIIPAIAAGWMLAFTPVFDGRWRAEGKKSQSPARSGAAPRACRRLVSSEAATSPVATNAIRMVHTALISGFTPRRTSE